MTKLGRVERSAHRECGTGSRFVRKRRSGPDATGETARPLEPARRLTVLGGGLRFQAGQRGAFSIRKARIGSSAHVASLNSFVLGQGLPFAGAAMRRLLAGQRVHSGLALKGVA